MQLSSVFPSCLSLVSYSTVRADNGHTETKFPEHGWQSGKEWAGQIVVPPLVKEAAVRWEHWGGFLVCCAELDPSFGSWHQVWNCSVYKNDNIIRVTWLEAQVMTILKLPLIVGQEKTVKEVSQRQRSLLVGVLPCKQVVNDDIRQAWEWKGGGKFCFTNYTLVLLAFLNSVYIFQLYARRQASKPEIRDGMELVPQPADRDSLCSCHRKKPLREDL